MLEQPDLLRNSCLQCRCASAIFAEIGFHYNCFVRNFILLKCSVLLKNCLGMSVFLVHGFRVSCNNSGSIVFVVCIFPT